MRRSFHTTLVLLIMFSIASYAIENETYFKFRIDSKSELNELTEVVSIDNVRGDTVYAYASGEEWNRFQNLNIAYEVLIHPGRMIKPEMTSSLDRLRQWDVYPTYETYLDIMYQFELDYPDLCEIIDIGSSVQGRSLLFARISDNISLEEDEPEVMYTATMHGDETTGYILTLRLIDSLLTAYGTDSLVTRLVDSCEIWINPLANPDGTYFGGNHTVYGAIRKNANGVDLNRNFPDPEDGDHPSGEWQPETVAMMQLAENNSFVIAANFHGGTEVVNYPWDTWPRRHADDNWFITVSGTYADSVQYYSLYTVMTGYNDGITNGWDWYEINGGRQDYMNWWHGCREVTIELTDIKLLPEDSLAVLWNYNRVSLLNYLEEALYGIRGMITDSATGLPVAARVEIINHDFDHSEVCTDPDAGDYHRMIEPGVYHLEFSADGYYPHTEYFVPVEANQITRRDIIMRPRPDQPVLTFIDHDGGEALPGDTVNLSITLKNDGGNDAANLTATLATADISVTVTQAHAEYPDIPSGGGTGTSLTEFEFYIEPSRAYLDEIEFLLIVTADGGYYDTLFFDFTVGERTFLYEDDFSVDLGWTGLGGPGEWIIGPAGGGYGDDIFGGPDPAYDVNPGSDNMLLGNDLTPESGGDYSADLDQTYWVTSPVIDCSDFTGVSMSYYYWLGVESNKDDNAIIQVYNGYTWTTLFANDSITIDELYWKTSALDISAYADGNPEFQIRFGIGPTNSTAQYCGWNIDDIKIKGYDHNTAVSPDIFHAPDSIIISLLPEEWKVESIHLHNAGNSVLRVKLNSTEEWLISDSGFHYIYPEDSLDLPVLISAYDLSSGNYDGLIYLESNDPLTPTVNTHIALEVLLILLCGDSNNDSNINLLDITFLIAYLYQGGPPPESIEMADVNSDGSINILDITYLIAYLYSGGPEPDCP